MEKMRGRGQKGVFNVNLIDSILLKIRKIAFHTSLNAKKHQKMTNLTLNFIDS